MWGINVLLIHISSRGMVLQSADAAGGFTARKYTQPATALAEHSDCLVLVMVLCLGLSYFIIMHSGSTVMRSEIGGRVEPSNPCALGLKKGCPISEQLCSLSLLCRLGDQLSGFSMPGSCYFEQPLTISKNSDDVNILVSNEEKQDPKI